MDIVCEQNFPEEVDHHEIVHQTVIEIETPEITGMNWLFEDMLNVLNEYFYIFRGPPTRRSQYRVLVTGLPASGSWQDLKDHMREAGDVCFADVYKDGTGKVFVLSF